MLRACAISKSYSGISALNGVSMEVDCDEIVGLIGPNGAGKTTLVNILSGFDRPSSGRVELNGQDVTGWSPRRRIQCGLSRTFQSARLFANLTVSENVEVPVVAAGTQRREAFRRAQSILELVGLSRYCNEPARSLPYGHQRLLGLARAIASDPRVLLMDEPAAGVEEAELPAFIRLLRRLRDEHECAVVLIDHNVHLILEVCDRIVVLDHGAVIAAGRGDAIRDNPDVIAAYIGGAVSA